jgi:FkbM family methyltransferase
MTLVHPWKLYLALLLTLVFRKPRKPVLLELKNGGCFLVNDFMQCFFYWEIFLFNTYDLHERSDEAVSIADVGANIGLATLLFKQLYPNAEMHCFEPAPHNFALLEKNISLSGLANIHLYNKGVDSTAHKATLYFHKTNPGGHSIYQVDHPSGSTEIDLISLRDLLAKTSANRCNILKMDCEGAEYEIIKAITSDLAPSFPVLVYEASPDKYDPEVLTHHLESLGYRVDDLGGWVYRASHSGISRP